MTQPLTNYEVNMPNAIWHGDLHEVVRMGEMRYLYMLIDDYSRFITAYAYFDTKEAWRTTEIFNTACQQYGDPLVYWSDNGTENEGDFKKNLQEKGIEHIYTRPYHPQANGKIERIWRDVNTFISNAETFDEVLEETKQFVIAHNNSLSHTTLEMIHGTKPAFPIDFFNQPKASSIDEVRIKVCFKEETLEEFLIKAKELKKRYKKKHKKH